MIGPARFVDARRGDQLEQALLLDLVRILLVFIGASADRGDLFVRRLGRLGPRIDRNNTHERHERRPDHKPHPTHRVFSKISRPISMRRISLVPAPIS